MKSSKIEKHLKRKRRFLGCFSKNNLPRFPSVLPASIIINDENPNEKHWIAIQLLPDKCLYFNSFGITEVINIKKSQPLGYLKRVSAIIEPEIIDFLRKKYNLQNILLNSYQIQDYKSKKCGLYCIAFIKNVFSVASYIKFIDKFDKNKTICNDKILKHCFF